MTETSCEDYDEHIVFVAAERKTLKEDRAVSIAERLNVPSVSRRFKLVRIEFLFVFARYAAVDDVMRG